MAVLTSDLPTLLGVTTGIAVLAGLICMVLHLFSKTKYPRHRNYADANIPPPIMYSTDTGTYIITNITNYSFYKFGLIPNIYISIMCDQFEEIKFY